VPDSGKHVGDEFRGQRHQEGGRAVVAQQAQSQTVRDGSGRRGGRGRRQRDGRDARLEFRGLDDRAVRVSGTVTRNDISL